MQSSSTVTLRAMVMLVCLVAVPLVAVSGTSLPKLLTDAIKGRKPSQPATAPAHGAGAVKGGGEAPPFSPTVRLPEHQVAVAADLRVPPIAANQAAANRVAAVPATPPRLAPAVAAAPLWGPGAPSTPTATAPASGQPTQHAEMQDRAPTGVSSASQRSPASTGTAQQNHPSTRNPPPAGRVVPAAKAETGERFTQIQTRLRELGASYYLLETWGNRGDQFRFHCKVANSPETFEATDRDPLAAMQMVLERVEASRGGR